MGGCGLYNIRAILAPHHLYKINYYGVVLINYGKRLRIRQGDGILSIFSLVFNWGVA